MRAATRADPLSARAHLRLGGVLVHSGEVQHAEAAFRLAARLDETLVGAHLGLAHCLVATGDYEGAARALDRGLETLPDALSLQVLLARLLAAAPDARVRRAARALELASLEPPVFPAQAETLAMAHAELANFAAACHWQESALAGTSDPLGREIAQRRLSRYRAGRPCRTPLEPAEELVLEPQDPD